MIITKLGKYRVLKDFKTRSSISIGQISKGRTITITQVDASYHKVIGPEFLDWEYWDLPVVLVTEKVLG